MKSIKIVLVIAILVIAVGLTIFINREGDSGTMNMETYTGALEPRIGYVELQVSYLDISPHIPCLNTA